MTFEELTEQFAIPGRLEFDEHHGMPRMQVRTESAEATIYLHGAHVTHFRFAGGAPVLFLSDRSEYAEDKAIRGGIPICFPWFGARTDGGAGPSHGFARIERWTLAFAAYLPGKPDSLTLSLVLGPTELSRSLGFDSFRAEYRVTVSETLTLALTVGNTGAKPLHFEEALHSYFAVGEVRSSAISGLEGARYVDKTDGMREKRAPEGALLLSAETDRVFPANSAAVKIDDTGNKRILRVVKGHSATTVVWNPWIALAAKLADLPDDSWPHFVCVEAANAGSDGIHLEPGEAHTMSAEISVTFT